MTYENWLDFYKKIGRLEGKIVTGRREWMEQGLGSGFSYYLYQKRVEGHRKDWNRLVVLGEAVLEEKFQEEFLALGIARLQDIRTQAMINRDDFPGSEEVQRQAEEIIREAESLLDEIGCQS